METVKTRAQKTNGNRPQGQLGFKTTLWAVKADKEQSRTLAAVQWWPSARTGLWEAKDSADDLDKEIKNKFSIG